MRTKRAWILPALCACLLCGCGSKGAVREQQLALRAQGMESALAGDYEAAVAAYDEALGLADMKVGALELDIASYKAAALYRQGNVQEAIDTCSAVLDLKKSAELYLTRGILYREAGDQESARADFSAAMDRTSKKDSVMRGRLSYYMEDYTAAKEYLEQAAEDGDQEGLYWQAELYWDTGNQDYAVTLYQSYLAGENAGHQEAYVKVASYQARQGDYDGALETLEAGIALGDQGNLQELLSGEIAVYEQRADFETAKLKMESYLESYPDDQEAAREYEFLKTR
ncbi:MAG: tetratricopeptide repeat protein [Eubacteriales bacterium]|nr:tetratricopeptide repeat protein [Eubacteriales bacterium]